MERSLGFGPTYEGGMANHLPMGLLALRGIGADDAKLEGFYQDYSARLDVVDSEAQQVVSLKHENLGRQELYYAYYRYFLESLSRRSVESVVTSAMEMLDEGISGSAFHCVIRLGYAIEWGEQRELAAALAFYVSDFQSLGRLQLRRLPSKGDSTTQSPCSVSSYRAIDVFNLVKSTGSLCEVNFDAVTIIEKLDYAAGIPEFRNVISLVERADITLEDIAAFCLQLYASTQNFTALHGITACHALRTVLPYCSDKIRVLRYFLVSILAAYVSIGAPAIQPHHYRGVVDWQRLMDLALESNNDHTIKLIYSCVAEYSCYKNPVYFYVAAKMIEREFTTDILD